ncbi:histidine kinase [Clostridium pasteurianum]|uniref:histidine kinase n=1 Tax=Clostridium pasteurianum TaxID=1501 RepID=UPI002260F771|nr:histidine kinase [Clostridium pasteurianum]UZW13233.1 histidine kinase [Clostridium pasteurianum]
MISTEKLLTQKDVAERWQVTTKAVENWRKDGILSPCKGLPVIRFDPQHIADLEGTKIEKFSPLERRRLERELEGWKLRAEKAEGALRRMNMIALEAIYTEESKV